MSADSYKLKIRLDASFTMRAAERQNEAPLALVSSHSASTRLRSAAAIPKSRGLFRSKGVPLSVQLALLIKLIIRYHKENLSLNTKTIN